MDLATLRMVRGKKTYVHVQHAGWTITSDVAVEALVRGEVDGVLDRALPGWLGRYVLPADAVLRYDDERAVNWDALLGSETLDDEGDVSVGCMPTTLLPPPPPPPPPLPEEDDGSDDVSDDGSDDGSDDEVDGWTDDEETKPHQSVKEGGQEEQGSKQLGLK